VAGSGIAPAQVCVEPDEGEAPVLNAIAGSNTSLWVEL
jgi:hypothetical protein